MKKRILLEVGIAFALATVALFTKEKIRRREVARVSMFIQHLHNLKIRGIHRLHFSEITNLAIWAGKKYRYRRFNPIDVNREEVHRLIFEWRNSI